MFDSTVNWLVATCISLTYSREESTIQGMNELRNKFFLPALRKFELGNVDEHLSEQFAALTPRQKENLISALGPWNHK